MQILRSFPEVSRWTPATGNHRNRIPKDYEDVADARQRKHGCSPRACSIPGKKFRVTRTLGSEAAGTRPLLHSQASLERLGLTNSQPNQRQPF
jgi:hypothetical protein